jgi:hypothetical protein
VLSYQLQYTQIVLSQLETQKAEAAIMLPSDYFNYAWDDALKVGIDPKMFTDTLQCESGFDPAKVGDQGTSFGIAQIHLISHPRVTQQEALDGIWAIDWAAQSFASQHASWWTCYRELQAQPQGPEIGQSPPSNLL